jgi:hypothetical protein
MISQSCLHNPALDPRQIARKPHRQTVLPAAVYCAKDPCAAFNRQTHPSNMPLIALDRTPSKVIRSICLQSPTSLCLLVPSFSPAAFHIQSYRMLNRSSNDPICHSHIGRYRPFLSQISLDQGPNCVGKLTGKPLTRNSSPAQPGRSQPRHHKAFLRLAWTHHIEALPRQSLHL